jgi:hypothetical protein
MASSNCLNIIGNGVVINLDALFSELERNGFTKNPESNWEQRLFISDCAHLVLPIHIEADGRQELQLGDKAFVAFLLNFCEFFCLFFLVKLAPRNVELGQPTQANAFEPASE